MKRFPKITPTRAFELLAGLGFEGVPPHWALNDVRKALKDHVRASLVPKRRRRRK